MRALSELLMVKDVMEQSGLSRSKVMKFIRDGELLYAYKNYKGAYFFDPDMVAEFVKKCEEIKDLIKRPEAKAILGVSSDSKFASMSIQPAGETPCGFKLYSKKALEEFMQRNFGFKSAEDVRANYYSLKEVAIILDETYRYLRYILDSEGISSDLQLFNHQHYFSRKTVEDIAESIGKAPNWEAVPQRG